MTTYTIREAGPDDGGCPRCGWLPCQCCPGCGLTPDQMCPRCLGCDCPDNPPTCEGLCPV
jgi:hypothetical protein